MSGTTTRLQLTKLMNARRSISLRSLDDLVGSHEDGLRNRQAQRLGGLEVDHQLELRRLLNRKIFGLRALQDLVHEDRCSAPDVVDVSTIRDQAAGVDILSEPIHQRKSVLGRQFREPLSVRKEDARRRYEESASTFSHGRSEDVLDFSGVS